MLYRVAARPYDEPPEATGCARLDAVLDMMHHLETTYEWETGWNDCCEDTYSSGEMQSYRRIQHPTGDGLVTFIFTEDKEQSGCWISTEEGSCTVLTKERYDSAIAALESGRFQEFAQMEK